MHMILIIIRKITGRLAQGLERLRDMQEASGPIPLSPILKRKRLGLYI